MEIVLFIPSTSYAISACRSVTDNGNVFLQCLGVQRSSLKILQRHKRDWIIDSLEIDEGYSGPFPYSLGFVSIYQHVRNICRRLVDIILKPASIAAAYDSDCRLSLRMKSELSTCTAKVLSLIPKVCYPSMRKLGRSQSIIPWTTRSTKS